ncbi:TadE/TadG family type IV pilus assembly protein [Sphingomonas oryzagri]
MIKASHSPLFRRPCALWNRLCRDRRGNILMITGLSLIPLSFAVGMGIDYSRAMRLQTKLNAAADAAALSAVTNTMMGQSSAVACATAKNMFVQQAGGLSGLVINTNDASQLSISLKDSSNPLNSTTSTCSSSSAATTASYSRTATVSYVAKSQNAFGNILGMLTLSIHGTSVANSAVAPNIDFYLVLDNSPSMALPSTLDGINTMVANTKSQGGCAFACHQYSVGNSDTAGNPKDPKTGKQMDNYALARSLKLVLRSDLVTDAASNLVQEAYDTSHGNGVTTKGNGAKYTMTVATFDSDFHLVQGKTSQDATSDVTSTQSSINGVTVPLMYANSYTMASNGTSGVYNNDTNTSYTNMGNGLSGVLALPGFGTKLPGDRPQGVIFIVTDGVRDEAVGGNVSNRWIGQLERPASTMPYKQAPYSMDPQVCETAKALGGAAGSMRIAILYTSYLPLPTNSFYNSNVAPFQAQIAANLKACASPGLFAEVSTDGDISTALSQLFQAAVATAHITK